MNNYDDLRSILSDSDFNRDMRLTRLQGFRGPEADRALRAGIGGRLAPALCGAGAILAVVLASPLLLAILALTAVIGTFAANHPIETAYNVFARRRGTEVPPNRAGRRLGCFMGAIFLGGATFAYTVGAPVVGAVLGLSLGVLAVFVAATNICVPSIILTLFRGSNQTKLLALFPALFGPACEIPDPDIA